jgi:hypothetical protein
VGGFILASKQAFFSPTELSVHSWNFDVHQFAAILSVDCNVPDSPLHFAMALPLEISSRLRSALDIVLARPQNFWAHDFLLRPGEDPPGDLSMLSNPVQLRHSIVMYSMHLIMRSPQAPPHTRTHDGPHGLAQPESSVSMDSVLIPAWTVGDVTVGAFIQRENTLLSQNGTASVKSMLRVGRFIRDESTSETLIIAVGSDDIPWERQVRLWYVKYQSSTKRYQFHAVCERNAFMDSRFEESVLFSTYDRQTRQCCVCGGPPFVACGCPLFRQVPRTPLDFSAFSRNALSRFHAGTFPKIRKTYGRSSMFSTLVADSMHWSMPGSEILAALRSSFIADDKLATDSLMAVVNIDDARALQSLGVQRSVRRLNLTQASLSSRPPYLQPCRVTPETDERAETASQIIEELFSEPVHDTRAFGENADGASEPCSNALVPQYSFADGTDDAVLSKLSACGSHVASNGVDIKSSTCGTLLGHGHDFVQDEQFKPESVAIIDSAFAKNSSSVEDEVNISGDDSGNLVLNEIPDASARLATAKFPTLSPSHCVVLDRKALRQKRNREAASRSNAKRRAYLQALKKDLEDVHGRVRSLRDRECELREFNVVLKDQAVKKWRSEMKAGVQI